MRTPYITLNNQSPKVQFKTSENSELYYVLVAWDELPAMLNEAFLTAENLGDSYWDDAAKKPTNGADKLESDLTIIGALMATLPEGSSNEGPSVFDKYASDSLKETVGKLIRQNQSTIPMATVASGVLSLAKNELRLEDFEPYMKGGTMYYCMTVARNKDGVEDGFKAIGEVNIPDTTPPILTVSSTAGAAADGWKGSLTMTFSEDLYWLDEDQKTIKEVWTAKPEGDKLETAIYILGAGSGLEATFRNLVLTSAATEMPRAIFSFDYSGVQPGDSITLFISGYASDAHMNGREKITLTFVTEEAGQNGQFLQGRFVITSGAIPGDSPVQ